MKTTLPLVAGLISLVALAGACAATPGPAPRLQDNRAEVTRQAERVLIRYSLDRDAPAWVFTDSALTREQRRPWRAQQWRVLTPGVVLDRAGFYDVLRTLDGSPVPRTVEIEARPRSVDLEAEYPTLAFSNGAIALPTRQANLFPAKSLAEVAALPSDLNGVSIPTPPIEVVWRDEAGPVLYAGQRWPRLITRMERSYVLMGQVDVTEGEGLTAVIDPALPQWMASTLAEAAPATGRWYRQRLGPASAGAQKPVLMAAWNGPTERMTSMGGSVLPGLIVMNFEGRGIVEPDDEIRERALWFIAHEAAHFWLGQAVRYEYARDAWITEGGADLMAVRALKARDPAYDDRAELQTEIDDCVARADQPLATAGERGEHRTYYACGAVIALAAEAVQKRRSGGDFLDFIGPLIDANREDGVLSRAEWLDALARLSGDARLIEAIEHLLDRGAADPVAHVASLLDRAGVAHRVVQGRIVLADQANG